MRCASNLEARLARKVTKAITTFDLVEDGNRVMVGLSGGKDSWALMQVLDVLRRRAPITVLARRRHRPTRGTPTTSMRQSPAPARPAAGSTGSSTPDIAEVMDEVLDADATPCSLFARLRRGVPVIALPRRSAPRRSHSGTTPTILSRRCSLTCSLPAASRRCRRGWSRMTGSTSWSGRLSTWPRTRHVRMRGRSDLPVIGYCCPVCGDLSLKRQRIKRLLLDFEREHPGVKKLDAKGAG